MKLSQITSRYFILIASVLFVSATVINLQVVKSTFFKSIDSVLHEEKNDLIFSFKHTDFADKVNLSENVHIAHVADNSMLSERFYTKQFFNELKQKEEDFRVIESYFIHNGKTYQITVSQPVSEALNLIDFYFFVSMVVIVGLVTLGTLLINYFVNQKLWFPFFHLLDELKSFKLNEKMEFSVEKTKIEEFKTLNNIVLNLIEKVKSDYISQKEFIDNTSHEFKTPLAIITHQLDELIQSPNLDEKNLFYIAKIQDSVRKLNHISKSITLLFKIENKHFNLLSNVLLDEVFKSQIEDLSFLGEEKNVKCKFYAKNEIEWEMDKHLANILVGNLVSNAYKYSSPHHEVSVRVVDHCIEIVNVGEIKESKVEELSDARYLKFSQHEDSQGLGLSIVKKIASIYKIKIYYIVFENLHCFRLEFGKNSTF
ncbi:MAG: HAMP domain-containing sensor histidine kinase [Cytophagales bacterium]